MTLHCAPIEPTDVMMLCGATSLAGHGKRISKLDSEMVYRVMLAAAPPPPADIAEALELAKELLGRKTLLTSGDADQLSKALLKSWGRE